MSEPERSGIRLILDNHDFRALWGAELVSTVGDRVHRVALATLVYNLTGSLTQTGVAFVATALPDLFLGLIAGALVDRWDRRKAMILCDLLRIPPVILIPFVAHVDLWLVYALLLVVNGLSIVFRPAKTAMIPSIVKPVELNTANSISSITENTADVLGYPLAGLIIGAASVWLGTESGLDAAFGLDALTYLLSAILVMRVRNRPVARDMQALDSIWSDLREGIAFVRSHPYVRSNTLVMLLGPLALGATTPLFVGYAWDVLQGGEWEYSLLGTGLGVGSILGGFWVGSLRDVRPGPMVLAGLGVMGVGVMAIAAVANLWLAMTLIALTGIGSMMVLIPSVTLVQMHTPDRLLGRVFSVRSTLIFGAIILTNAAGGWAGQAFGVARSLFMCGALVLVVVFVAALFPTVRGAALTGMTVEANPHLEQSGADNA